MSDLHHEEIGQSNDATATFEWLDRAWSNRDDGIVWLLFDPFILRCVEDVSIDTPVQS